MPYLGVKLEHNRLDLTVRIYGPDMVFFNTVELKRKSGVLIRSYESTNLQDICDRLSRDICDDYCDGNKLVWVQVDLAAPNGVVCGSSADKEPL